MKKVNVYRIKDEVVSKSISAFGDSLKYLCESNKRKKDGSNSVYSSAFWYYHTYFQAFDVLHGNKPFEEVTRRMIPKCFLNAMVQEDKYIETLDLIEEFLQAVSHYMLRTYNEETTVIAIPMLFDESYENTPYRYGLNVSPKYYGKYVKMDLLIGRKYSAKELRDMTISVTWLAESKMEK